MDWQEGKAGNARRVHGEINTSPRRSPTRCPSQLVLLPPQKPASVTIRRVHDSLARRSGNDMATCQIDIAGVLMLFVLVILAVNRSESSESSIPSDLQYLNKSVPWATAVAVAQLSRVVGDRSSGPFPARFAIRAVRTVQGRRRRVELARLDGLPDSPHNLLRSRDSLPVH